MHGHECNIVDAPRDATATYMVRGRPVAVRPGRETDHGLEPAGGQ